jgi:hypothetical protein
VFSSLVHKGFFDRSRIISIQYFLDKIILDDYKVVFTGHSLGAAVAALVAVRVIFNGNISDPRKKVFFIGFGCPPMDNIVTIMDNIVTIMDNIVTIMDNIVTIMDKKIKYFCTSL